MPNRKISKNDIPAPQYGGGQVLGDSQANNLPAVTASVPEPTELALATGTEHTSQSARAFIKATWQPPISGQPKSYRVQWSQVATFTGDTTQTAPASVRSAVLENLPCDTVYFVRVAAVYNGVTSPWTAAVSITTAKDTAPPPMPTGLSATFSAQGDLVVTWTPGYAENYQHTEIRIYSDATKATRYLLDRQATGRYVWTALQNRNATSGSPDAAVYVEVDSVNWGGVHSAAVSTPATKARPATPSGASATWDAVAGTCTFAWTPVVDASTYVLTIDGVARVITDTRLAYTVAQNRIEHSGTPDPILTWALVAVDALDQTSATPAGGTATLPPPATPTGATATWSGKTGSCTFGWNAVAQIVGYRLTLDGKARDLSPTSYVYDLALNKLEHGGVGDPSLTWALVAVDGLGQVSAAPAGGTATLPPPATPVGALAAWTPKTGVCTFAWTSTGADVLGYRLTIDGSQRSMLHPTASYAYDAPRNRAEHGGTADPSLDWALVAYDALDQVSTTPASGNAFLPPPAKPDPHSWVFTGIDAIWTWNDDAAFVNHYRLTIDGVARVVPTQNGVTASYTYPFALNKQEHSGTPDPQLTYALVAVDGIDQISAAATGTAINLPPDAPTSVALIAGATQIAISVIGIRPSDFDHYHYRVLRDGVTATSFDSSAALAQYLAGAGLSTYQVGATISDVFAQASVETLSAIVELDPLTLDTFRADIVYRDNLGNPESAYDPIKDGNKSSGGVFFSTGEYWTQTERAQIDRYKPITLAAAQPLTCMLALSVDGVTWQWFAGPFASDGRTLTAYGSGVEGSAASTAAYTHRATLPVGKSRVDLPVMTDARFVRLYHTSGSGDYTIYEYYPQRYVQADAVDAELIRGMTIVGNQFIADKLSAIAALLGEVTISGVADIGVNGGIWQGTSGNFDTPVRGFKLWNDAGVGRLATYKDGIEQVGLDSNGALRFGGGAGALDQTGLRFLSDTTAAATQMQRHIDWIAPNGVSTAALYGFAASNGQDGGLFLMAQPQSSATSSRADINLQANADGGNYATMQLKAYVNRGNTGTGNAGIEFTAHGRTAGGVNSGAGLSVLDTGVETNGAFAVKYGATAYFSVNQTAILLAVNTTIGGSLAANAATFGGAVSVSGAATFGGSVTLNGPITTAVTAPLGAFTGSATPYVPGTAGPGTYQYAVEIGHTGAAGAGFIQTTQRGASYFGYGVRALDLIAGGDLRLKAGGATTWLTVRSSGLVEAADDMTVNGTFKAAGALLAMGGFTVPSAAALVLGTAGGGAFVTGHNGTARIGITFQGNGYTFENTAGGAAAQITNSGEYLIGGTRVLTARQAAIASPAATTAALKTFADAVRAVFAAHGLTG